jgi:hypothetical protein
MALSDDILGAFEGSEGEATFGMLLDRIEGSGYGIFLAILSIPSALPVPAPGYSVPFALALMPIAIQMLRGRTSPWFPDKIRNRPIKGGADSKFLKAAAKFIRFWERLIKPRGIKVMRSKGAQRGLALAVLFCSLSMMLPIPLTNTIPALGIFLIGIALLEDDIVFAVMGLAVAAVGLSVTGLIVFVILSIIRSGFTGGWGELMDQAEVKAKALIGR